MVLIRRRCGLSGRLPPQIVSLYHAVSFSILRPRTSPVGYGLLCPNTKRVRNPVVNPINRHSVEILSNVVYEGSSGSVPLRVRIMMIINSNPIDESDPSTNLLHHIGLDNGEIH